MKSNLETTIFDPYWYSSKKIVCAGGIYLFIDVRPKGNIILFDN